jgi:hypothetical protein
MRTEGTYAFRARLLSAQSFVTWLAMEGGAALSRMLQRACPGVADLDLAVRGRAGALERSFELKEKLTNEHTGCLANR